MSKNAQKRLKPKGMVLLSRKITISVKFKMLNFDNLTTL